MAPEPAPDETRTGEDGRLLARAFHGAREQLLALTPGQQWTTALVLVLATAVVVYGTPASRVIGVRSPQPATPAAAPAPSGDLDAETSGEPAAGGGSSFEPIGATPPPAPSGGGPVDPTGGSGEPGTDDGDGGDEGNGDDGNGGDGDDGDDGNGGEPFVAPHVVAAVRGGDAAPGETDEATIAERYLGETDLEWTTVVLDEEDAPCEALTAAGDVVVAADGLDEELTTCITDAGLDVVAYDVRGGTDGTGGTGGDDGDDDGSGSVVSTRRSLSDSLVDLAERLGDGDALSGDVGIAADEAHREQVEDAVARVADAGVDVTATAYLEDESDVPPAVLDFAGQGISTVVFATDVSKQSAWATQQSVLDPGVRYVVVDAADSVVDESYPPVFDGALAHTSVRVPWFSRTHGSTPTQDACREIHEPGDAAGDDELVLAYQWCQHVELVDSGVAEAESSGAGLDDALRSVEVASPLTSDLGPLADETFGPGEDAVLRWAADCGCWVEEQAFEERG